MTGVVAGAGAGATAEGPPAATTLDRVETGATVELVGFEDAMEPAFRDQLLAYGVHARQRLRVVQQSPMTIVLCDHVELALEGRVARMMRVRPAGRD